MKKTDAAQFANKALKKAIWSKFYPAGTYSTSSASMTGSSGSQNAPTVSQSSESSSNSVKKFAT